MLDYFSMNQHATIIVQTYAQYTLHQTSWKMNSKYETTTSTYNQNIPTPLHFHLS